MSANYYHLDTTNDTAGNWDTNYHECSTGAWWWPLYPDINWHSICPKYGKTSPAEYRYCPNCGYQLHPPPKPTLQTITDTQQEILKKLDQLKSKP